MELTISASLIHVSSLFCCAADFLKILTSREDSPTHFPGNLKNKLDDERPTRPQKVTPRRQNSITASCQDNGDLVEMLTPIAHHLQTILATNFGVEGTKMLESKCPGQNPCVLKTYGLFYTYIHRSIYRLYICMNNARQQWMRNNFTPPSRRLIDP